MGSFTCDFDSSYFNTDTINQPGEIYRQWVPLVNQVDSRQSGIMGHLKLSIRFVGPGDVPIPHNLPEELKQEKLAIAKGEPLPVLFPADVKPTLNFLVFSVYRAQGLPPMDSTMALSSMAKSFSGSKEPDILCNPYVTILFGDNAVQRTETAEYKYKKTLEKRSDGKYNAAWRQQIWLPIEVPTMGNTIIIQVKDEDKVAGQTSLASDDLIATAPFFNFKDYQTLTDKPKPFWVNLYSAPHPPPAAQAQEAKHMNEDASLGSHYSGRLLMSLHRDENKRPVKLPQEVVFRKVRKLKGGGLPASINHSSNRRLPPECKYVLRLGLFAGAGFKKMDKSSFKQSKDPFRVEFTCGDKVDWASPDATALEGSVDWLGSVSRRECPDITDRVKKAEFPEDPAQVPDLIVYLVPRSGSHKDKRVAYRRFNAKDIIENPEKYARPQWWDLSADPCLGSFFAKKDISHMFDFGMKAAHYEHPGSLLLRFAMYQEPESEELLPEALALCQRCAADKKAANKKGKGGNPPSFLKADILSWKCVNMDCVGIHDTPPKEELRVKHEVEAQRTDEGLWEHGIIDRVYPSPGSKVLCDITFTGDKAKGNPEETVQMIPQTRIHVKKESTWKKYDAADSGKYQIQVNLYQARDLPAADASGLIDPYWVLLLNGHRKKTTPLLETSSPLMYETVIFDDVTLPSEDNFDLWPKLVIQLWDEDKAYGISGGDDHCGTVRVPLCWHARKSAHELKAGFRVEAKRTDDHHCPFTSGTITRVSTTKAKEIVYDIMFDAVGSELSTKERLVTEIPQTRIDSRGLGVLEGAGKFKRDHDYHSRPLEPTWHKILDVEGHDTLNGEILMSVRCLKYQNIGAKKESPRHPPSICPDFEDATIEITSIGCRNLKPLSTSPLRKPFMDFRVNQWMNPERKSSAKHWNRPVDGVPPNGSDATNPNFGANGFDIKNLYHIKLPLVAKFAPTLRLSVKDKNATGLSTCRVGYGFVHLEDKMPFTTKGGRKRGNQYHKVHNPTYKALQPAIKPTTSGGVQLQTAGDVLMGCFTGYFQKFVEITFRFKMIAGLRKLSHSKMGRKQPYEDLLKAEKESVVDAVVKSIKDLTENNLFRRLSTLHSDKQTKKKTVDIEPFLRQNAQEAIKLLQDLIKTGSGKSPNQKGSHESRVDDEWHSPEKDGTDSRRNSKAHGEWHQEWESSWDDDETYESGGTDGSTIDSDSDSDTDSDDNYDGSGSDDDHDDHHHVVDDWHLDSAGEILAEMRVAMISECALALQPFINESLEDDPSKRTSKRPSKRLASAGVEESKSDKSKSNEVDPEAAAEKAAAEKAAAERALTRDVKGFLRDTLNSQIDWIIASKVIDLQKLNNVLDTANDKKMNLVIEKEKLEQVMSKKKKATAYLERQEGEEEHPPIKKVEESKAAWSEQNEGTRNIDLQEELSATLQSKATEQYIHYLIGAANHVSDEYMKDDHDGMAALNETNDDEEQAKARVRAVKIRAYVSAFEAAEAMGIWHKNPDHLRRATQQTELSEFLIPMSKDLLRALGEEIESAKSSTSWFQKLRQAVAEASKVDEAIVAKLLQESEEVFLPKQRSLSGGMNERERSFMGSKDFYPREVIEQNLENLYGTKETDLEGRDIFRMSPIEDYLLYRGAGDGVGARVTVGHWKGIIRIKYPKVGETDQATELFRDSLKNEKVVVRLYITQAENLESQDANGKWTYHVSLYFILSNSGLILCVSNSRTAAAKNHVKQGRATPTSKCHSVAIVSTLETDTSRTRASRRFLSTLNSKL